MIDKERKGLFFSFSFFFPFLSFFHFSSSSSPSLPFVEPLWLPWEALGYTRSKNDVRFTHAEGRKKKEKN